MKYTVGLLLAASSSVVAFSVANHNQAGRQQVNFASRALSSQTTHATPTTLFAVSYESISDIGYEVSVKKPLGVIFAENDAPFGGLAVADVEPGQAGGQAGLRAGDQLLSINGDVVIGDDFDTVMSFLRMSSDPMDLLMFRGTVRQLYSILGNRQVDTDEEEDDDAVIMDENYESPVVIPIDNYDDSPLTAGEVFGAFKKIGSIMTGGDSPKKEKKGGFFGMFKQESIQLDGDDASSIK